MSSPALATSRHYLEEELYSKIRSDPEIFDFLQTSSLDGLWYWDLESPEDEWMNEGFWRLFGIDPATRQHKAAEWQDLIDPDDLEVALENFQRHLEDPSHPYDQIVRYRHADGGTVTVRCRGLAIRDAVGKPIRMLGAHTDLTAQRQAEEDLAISQAVSQAQNAFLSTMGHEIRTPLNAIAGFLQLLGKADLPDRQKIWAEKGLEATKNLEHTLDMIMAASVMQQGLVTITETEAGISSILRHAENCLEGGLALAGKHVDYSCTASPDLPATIRVDVLKLNQILNNLIDNAIKFTSRGRIEVILARGDSENGFEMTVRDTGIGLEKGQAADVFNMFHQNQQGASRGYGGTGLGLSISRGLARLMGGDLEIRGLETGTEVRLTLPLDGTEGGGPAA